jgi:hypothetical protein
VPNCGYYGATRIRSWLHPDLPGAPKVGPEYPHLRTRMAPPANGEF